MNPFGHHEDRLPVSARALVLTPPVPPGAPGAVATSLAIEMPDGRILLGSPSWFYRDCAGVIGLGRWVPVTLTSDNPDEAALDSDHVPYDSEVAELIAEALGGPAVAPAALDDWRVRLALQFAEEIIAAGDISPAQADAIRTRIKRGV